MAPLGASGAVDDTVSAPANPLAAAGQAFPDLDLPMATQGDPLEPLVPNEAREPLGCPAYQDDADSGRDAGEDFSSAVALPEGRSFSCLGAFDEADWFTFAAVAGETVKVRLQGPFVDSALLELIDCTTAEVLDAATLDFLDAAEVELAAQADGPACVRVVATEESRPWEYWLTLTRGPLVCLDGDDDAGQEKDATPGSPLTVADGTFDGCLVAEDDEDRYVVHVHQGWLVTVELEGGEDACWHRDLSLYLAEPGGSTLDSDRDRCQGSVEFVSDAPADLLIRVRADLGEPEIPYVLTVTLEPAPLDPVCEAPDDAESGRDAGDRLFQAVPIEPGTHTGCVSDGHDLVDYYSLQASAGDLVTIGLEPADTEEGFAVLGSVDHGTFDLVLSPLDKAPFELQYAPVDSGELIFGLHLVDPAGDYTFTLTVEAAGIPSFESLDPGDMPDAWQRRGITSCPDGVHIGTVDGVYKLGAAGGAELVWPGWVVLPICDADGRMVAWEKEEGLKIRDEAGNTRKTLARDAFPYLTPQGELGAVGLLFEEDPGTDDLLSHARTSCDLQAWGEQTAVKDPGIGVAVAAAPDGTVYILDHLQNLSRLDTATGEQTTVASVDFLSTDVTFDGLGNAYVVNGISGLVHRVKVTTGVATGVATIVATGAHDFPTLTFHGTDLYVSGVSDPDAPESFGRVPGLAPSVSSPAPACPLSVPDVGITAIRESSVLVEPRDHAPEPVAGLPVRTVEVDLTNTGALDHPGPFTLVLEEEVDDCALPFIYIGNVYPYCDRWETIGTAQVTMEDGPLAPGDVHTVTFDWISESVGTHVLRATVTSGLGPDDDPSNDQLTTTAGVLYDGPGLD